MPKRLYRALFYVFDGGHGIGHLRRLARIAAAMQESFSCLIVTGHDLGPQWIVPKSCEYVRLPAWDSIIPAKAAYWNRAPFLDVSLDEAVRLRQSILKGVFDGFRPDVLLVDHLPLGAYDELAPLVRHSPCRKYLVTRGIQNETEDIQRLMLGGDALESLRRDYMRILSAIDRQVFDLSDNYGLPDDVCTKISSVGYVGPEAIPNLRRETRKIRGLEDDTIWVVASAGSGQRGEQLIEACMALCDLDREVHFDIVIGPRSRLSFSTNGPVYLDGGRVRLHSYCHDLANFHSAADLVITTGGYNSFLEILRGQARILCFPYRNDPKDEPIRHANCLKRFVELDVEVDIAQLPALFSRALNDCKAGSLRDNRTKIDVDGATRIAQLVVSDLFQPEIHENEQ
jgi:predicted glycosyltransferase